MQTFRHLTLGMLFFVIINFALLSISQHSQQNDLWRIKKDIFCASVWEFSIFSHFRRDIVLLPYDKSVIRGVVIFATKILTFDATHMSTLYP